jgi:2,3-bisphosphoglycerate-independent phosphoglycerate mutase
MSDTKVDQPDSQDVQVQQKVMLISIDGWGLSDEVKGNAVVEAETPIVDGLLKNALAGSVDASGLSVGLPKGVMGNSEVGHLTMGAGRAQFQSLTRIDAAVEAKALLKQEAFANALERAKSGNGRMHFLGLVSDGGVHSHILHLFEMLREAKAYGVPNSYVHFFGDGRDTKPTSATKYIKQLQDYLEEQKYGSLATVTGRYYAMDRDTRWERIEKAYDGIVGGIGEESTPADLISLVEKRYAAGENDEFLTPIIVNKEGTVQDGDTCLFFDFRADRMRQITQCLGIEPKFEAKVRRSDVSVTQMTEYDASFPLPVVFPPIDMSNVLGEWVSKHGLGQFHTAETEKYAHVTFFFNGGRETMYDGEERKLVSSPKVATYDLKPEMSVSEVADVVCETLATETFPFAVCNLAPPDMVGHTGVYDATVKAVTATDIAIGRIYETCKKHNYALLITSDHGNCEEMLDENGKPKTAHTTNPVFFIIANTGDKFELARQDGGLADVAPTVLHIMGLRKPKEMTGESMLKAK